MVRKEKKAAIQKNMSNSGECLHMGPHTAHAQNRLDMPLNEKLQLFQLTPHN